VTDHIVLASDVAVNLGLTLPFPRQMGMSGAAGSYAMTLSFLPDGLVPLFVTDYREYCYLPSPLIGFHPPAPPGASGRPHLQLSRQHAFTVSSA
jgi:hypothetical protein